MTTVILTVAANACEFIGASQSLQIGVHMFMSCFVSLTDHGTCDGRYGPDIAWVSLCLRSIIIVPLRVNEGTNLHHAFACIPCDLMLTVILSLQLMHTSFIV